MAFKSEGRGQGSAGQARDDHVEESNDTVDDGFADRTDCVDDAHQASADGVEDTSDLYRRE
ncbi:pentatricopeptide repeat protein [Aspergillus luchuensis]|uniref:Pentatricopeptide repeat protein n=1 Tax=Aspergillus kawachii TaxID=1069201 RepID=A0A146FXZ7_ASPKA|nr:pentatricopeptide repeat protein [Aspergillus luchuensis]